MEKLKFQTTIKCGGCIAAVKPHLDAHPAISTWAVDTAHPDKIMEVETILSADEIHALLGKIGYVANPM
jgi:copper chaperone